MGLDGSQEKMKDYTRSKTESLTEQSEHSRQILTSYDDRTVFPKLVFDETEGLIKINVVEEGKLIENEEKVLAE